jgi:hypothetical protein
MVMKLLLLFTFSMAGDRSSANSPETGCHYYYNGSIDLKWIRTSFNLFKLRIMTDLLRMDSKLFKLRIPSNPTI